MSGEMGANKVVGRDGMRQTIANSASKGGVGVTIGHQSISTCPMATLGPPKDPTDTNTWSGGDNRPSTDVYLPNGCIRPSNKSKIILDTKEESERKGRLIPCPISNVPVNLDQERLGSGVWQFRHQQKACLPPT